MYIKYSVGQGGINDKNDASFVQEILTLIANEDFRLQTLVVDGKCGKKTLSAIYTFQSLYVKLKAPDSRIDPNGRSEKILVAKAIEIDKTFLEDIIKKYKLGKARPSVYEKVPRTITYRKYAKKVLSSYTENIVKLAMFYAGNNKCDISSTLRTFDDQSRIMYNNCASYSGATSVDSLRSARGWGYAAPGKEVETVYYEKQSEGKDATIAAMKAKIESLYKQNKKVSLHCVSEADYKKRNILDIPYSSVLSNKLRDFETSLMGMTNEIKNARYPRPIVGEIYIDKLIIEDKCWHLEILQHYKILPVGYPLRSRAPYMLRLTA